MYSTKKSQIWQLDIDLHKLFSQLYNTTLKILRKKCMSIVEHTALSWEGGEGVFSVHGV